MVFVLTLLAEQSNLIREIKQRKIRVHQHNHNL